MIHSHSIHVCLNMQICFGMMIWYDSGMVYNMMIQYESSYFNMSFES